MTAALLTRASLLVRLRDPQDSAAWQQFVELYSNLVYGFARQHGLQDADAADLTQEVFLAVARMMGHWRYDPQQGTFRGWLFGLTHHKLTRFLRRRHAHPPGNGGSDAHQRLAEQPDPAAIPESAWEQEFRQHLFRRA